MPPTWRSYFHEQTMSFERRQLLDICADDPVFGEVLRAWERFGASDDPADQRRFMEIAMGALGGYGHIVDTSTAPENYTYKLFSSRVTLYNNSDLTGRRVIDLPWRALAERCVADYGQAAGTGAPILHRVRLTQLRERPSVDNPGTGPIWDALYDRLLVPLGGGTPARRLLVAIAPQRVGNKELGRPVPAPRLARAPA
jgi:hypothetical protein